MKKLKKLKLNESNILTNSQLKNIVGGFDYESYTIITCSNIFDHETGAGCETRPIGNKVCILKENWSATGVTYDFGSCYFKTEFTGKQYEGECFCSSLFAG